ncbi:MAG: hypothetical protein ACRERR_12865 [Moraxellaceae bacterium]
MRLCVFLICSLFSGLLLPLLAHAEATPGRQLAEALLAAGGTAAVFEAPVVQAALRDPQPFLGGTGAARFDRLLADAGLRRWQPPRVWLLQEQGEGTKRHWENAAALIQANAALRAYPVVLAVPLPSAAEAIGFLTPGKVHPGLRGLLAAYEADMLVLLRGQQWTVWHVGGARQGVLPGTGTELLADVIAELAASEQQWPEARGRELLQVNGVASLADFAAVQSALQALPGVQQLQLVRAEKDRIWFAWSAPSAVEMAQLLMQEPRLLAAPVTFAGLPGRVSEACHLACQQLLRRWQPELLPKPSAAPAVSVQSPPFP